jgi:hypothetical protein
MRYIVYIVSTIIIILTSCSTDDEKDSVKKDSDTVSINKNQILDSGEGITLKFLDGLNDDPRFKLERDLNGYYFLTLNSNSNQTIQRITGKLLRNGKPVEDIWTGNQPKKVNWESNLFWWLLEGDIVAKITKTYINAFTGQITYVNLPPITNWRDVLVPTLNSSAYTDQKTGIVNTVIAPIFKMKGDTLKVKMTYSHGINQKKFKDSTYIILK